jgi:hypothetical protein
MTLSRTSNSILHNTLSMSFINNIVINDIIFLSDVLGHIGSLYLKSGVKLVVFKTYITMCCMNLSVLMFFFMHSLI